MSTPQTESHLQDYLMTGSKIQVTYENICNFETNSALFQKHFDLPETEFFIKKFSCTSSNQFQLCGHLYITPNYICFYTTHLRITGTSNSYLYKIVFPINKIRLVRDNYKSTLTFFVENDYNTIPYTFNQIDTKKEEYTIGLVDNKVIQKNTSENISENSCREICNHVASRSNAVIESKGTSIPSTTALYLSGFGFDPNAGKQFYVSDTCTTLGNVDIQSYFNLPDTEFTIQKYYCFNTTLFDQHGYLYVTPKYICFETIISEKSYKIVLPIDTLRTVTNNKKDFSISFNQKISNISYHFKDFPCLDDAFREIARHVAQSGVPLVF